MPSEVESIQLDASFAWWTLVMPTFWQRNGALLRVSPTCITNLNPTYTPQAHFVLSFLHRFRDATDYHTLVYYHVMQRSVWSNAYALLHFYITCVSRFQWSLAYACFTLSSRFINVCLQVMTLTKFIVIMSTSTCLDPGFIMLIIGVTTPFCNVPFLQSSMPLFTYYI